MGRTNRHSVATIRALEALKVFLEEAVVRFSGPEFLKQDPVCIPHSFSEKEDREISGFLTALIAWGNRASILNSARRLTDYMEGEPFRFVIHRAFERKPFPCRVVHRTFQADDLLFVLEGLHYLYTKRGGLEGAFGHHLRRTGNLLEAIGGVRQELLSVPHLARSRKHLANPSAGSHAKRILMFLRWMVRPDPLGIDFGLWQQVKPADLYCPLDVHTGRAARALGLLRRKTDDRRAVEELTYNLRSLCPDDPVRYDIALFHLGRPENRVLLTHAPLFPACDV